MVIYQIQPSIVNKFTTNIFIQGQTPATSGHKNEITNIKITGNTFYIFVNRTHDANLYFHITNKYLLNNYS